MNADRIEEAVAEAVRVLRERPSALVSDVDGTLSPVVAKPEEAVVLPECRSALLKLAGRLDLVAVISGRTAADARRMVGLDGLLYIGNHGLERWDRVDGYRNEAAAFEDEIRELRATLEEALRETAGVRIEDKGVILSLHYRGAARPQTARQYILDLLDRLLPTERLAIAEGKMVVEVRPALKLDKGVVIEGLVEDRGLRGVVFLGDDRTDVDAMRALRRLCESGVKGLAIGVMGDEAPEELLEASHMMLPGPAEVASLLERLAEVLST